MFDLNDLRGKNWYEAVNELQRNGMHFTPVECCHKIEVEDNAIYFTNGSREERTVCEVYIANER